MGSLTFDGVRFIAYTNDHLPVHVHGFYAGIEVVIELTPDFVDLVRGRKNVIPANAKRADVAHVLNTAYTYRHELLAIWRSANAASRR